MSERVTIVWCLVRVIICDGMTGIQLADERLTRSMEINAQDICNVYSAAYSMEEHAFDRHVVQGNNASPVFCSYVQARKV